MHASAQAVRPLIRNISQVTPLGLLKTKKKVSAAPPPYRERAAQKQCADKNLGTKFRQRGNSLYLAFLIGRAKSTHSYAFFRFLRTSSAPFSLLRLRAAFAISAETICILQAGSMRSLAFSTRAVACSSSGS